MTQPLRHAVIGIAALVLIAVSILQLERARARPGADGLIPDETHFLNALKESVETGKVPADELLDHYNGDWAGDLTRIYGAYRY